MSPNSSSVISIPPGLVHCPLIVRKLDRTIVFLEISHNHPEGIKGAQATALAVYLARRTDYKKEIQKQISQRFGYDLNRKLEDIRPVYSFDVSCQGTVAEAIISFLESESYEDAIRNAISLGGDSDTLACITGGIAEAFYGEVPGEIRRKVEEILPPDLWDITERFCGRFIERKQRDLHP